MRASALRPRNGPPLAVRTRRATSVIRSPARHCQIAECSLSIGRRRSRGSPPSSSSNAVTRCPPTISVSLFASATRRPARSAARTAGSAAIPVVATTTSRLRRPLPAARGHHRPSARRRSLPVAPPPSTRWRPARRRAAPRRWAVAAGGQAPDGVAVAERCENLESLAADRPGRAEDRDAGHATRPATRSA